MTTRDEPRRRRAEVRRQFGELYAELSTILFQEDPIGINFGTNTDEYEPEVDTILPRLAQCGDEHDVRTVVHEEFVRWFDVTTAGPAEAYARIAARIWAALVVAN